MSVAPQDWPIALRLLCGCLDEEPSSQTQALAAQMQQADWHALLHLACTRHRVAPVLATQFGRIDFPAVVADELRREVRALTIGTLRQSAALAQIMERLSSQGIDTVVLKGLPLAERLYGSAGNRHARDIDVLVPPDQIRPAAKVLEQLGYAPAPQYRLRGRLVGTRALAQECYDLEYVGGLGPLAVELHWRTSHYAGWPDFAWDADMTEVMHTTIGPVRVPSDGPNLMYLAGHGSMHAFARLKWLADIGRLARIRGCDGLEQDIELARGLGGLLPLELALRLAHVVMGSPLPTNLPAPSAQVAKLQAQMLRVISAPEIAPGTWRYRLSANLLSLQLAAGPGQVAGVLRYAIWRRLRLGAAGLWQSLGRQPALQ